MTTKLSEDQSKTASEILGRLDRVAKDIQDRHASWGMSFEAAKDLVNHIDRVADQFELATFGEESLVRRAAEVLKTAKVVQREPDEAYMDSFATIHGIEQAEGDEPYMAAYRDDQSSAVQTGVATNGRPLAPGHQG